MVNPSRKKKTARFTEIAALAGVSIATVDRVLNERDTASVKTREKVVQAARQLGVPRVLPETRHGLVHIDIVLPDNPSPFFQRLNQAMQRGVAMLDKRLVVHRVTTPEEDEAALVRAIGRVVHGGKQVATAEAAVASIEPGRGSGGLADGRQAQAARIVGRRPREADHRRACTHRMTLGL